MSCDRVSPRQLSVIQTAVSDRDLAILRRVADLRLMSARQIEVLHFSSECHRSPLTAARTCRRVLERLVAHRLLVRLDRRIGGVRAGSASYVYALGPAGQRLIGLGGPRRRLHEPSARFLDHTLAIGQLVVALTVAASEGLCEVLNVETEPHCWRPLGGARQLRPDLFVALGVGDFEHRWFVEVDRGQEHLPTLVRKCRVYDTYYRSGKEQAAHGVFPRACWVVPDKHRADRLQRSIRSNRDLSERLFTVTTEPQAVTTLCEGAT